MKTEKQKQIRAFLLKVFKNNRTFSIAQTDNFEKEGCTDAHKMTTLFLCDRCKNYSTSSTEISNMSIASRYSVCDFCLMQFNEYFKD